MLTASKTTLSSLVKPKEPKGVPLMNKSVQAKVKCINELWQSIKNVCMNLVNIFFFLYKI
jgi:hypothetical protein